MPRYFFNIHDGRSDPDEEGTELPDHHAACCEAIRFAGRIIDDEAHRIAAGGDWRLEVTDSSGAALFRLAFHVSEPQVGGLP